MELNKRLKKGFTLIEVLVSITILTIIIAVPMTIISDALISNRETKNSLAAQSIAQSILEEKRSQRDSNFIVRADWKTGLTLFSNKDEEEEQERQDLAKCNDPIFTCEINISEGFHIPAASASSVIEYITITVQVSWPTQFRGKEAPSIKLSETLYRWLEYSVVSGNT